MTKIERKLSAIVCADVAGYSRLMNIDEAGTLDRVQAHLDELVTPKITEHHGRVVKLMGDGLLAEFASVVDAVQCFVEIQRAMAERNAPLPEAQKILYRVGVTVGDIIARGDDIYGNAVNVAARIEGLAESGGMYLSGTAREQVGKSLALTYDDLGEHEVKNIDEPVRVYRVRLASDREQVEPAATPTPGARPKIGWPAIAAVSAVAIAGLALWVSFREPGPETEATPAVATSPPAVQQASIAVLPFVNLSADKEQEYFSDGIAEELLNVLVRIKGLKVSSRTSSFYYKGKSVKLRTIADELGVANILEGSVRKAGNRVRITAQLINARDDSHLWSQSFDRELTDIFAIQDEIAQAIVTALKVTLIGETKGSKTDNIQAYDRYLLGRHHLHQRTPESLAKAVELFEQVVALDPDYALAYSGLADAYMLLTEYGNLSTGDATQKAKHSIATALRLDDQLAEAHASNGLVNLINGDNVAAQTALRRAIELNPGYSMAHMWLGNSLTSSGQTEQGYREHNRALSVDPLHPTIVSNTAFDLHFLGRAEAALELYRKHLAAAGPSSMSYRALTGLHGMSGQLVAALDWARKAIALDPDHPSNLIGLSEVYAALGQFEEAEQWLRRAEEVAPKNFQVQADRFFLYLDRGDHEALAQFTPRLLVGVPTTGPLGNTARTAHLMTGISHVLAQDHPRAIRHLQTALGGSYVTADSIQFDTLTDLDALAWLAFAYQKAGRDQATTAVLEKSLALIDLARQGGMAVPDLDYRQARIQALQGQTDETIVTLRSAVDAGWRTTVAFNFSLRGYWSLLREPTWDNVRDDPAFKEIVARVKADVDGMRARVAKSGS